MTAAPVYVSVCDTVVHSATAHMTYFCLNNSFYVHTTCIIFSRFIETVASTVSFEERTGIETMSSVSSSLRVSWEPVKPNDATAKQTTADSLLVGLCVRDYKSLSVADIFYTIWLTHRRPDRQRLSCHSIISDSQVR